MELIFVMGWNHPSQGILPLSFIALLLVISAYLFKTRKKQNKLFMIALFLFTGAMLTADIIMALDHYKYFSNFKSESSELKTIEGIITNRERHPNTSVDLYIDNKVISYHGRTGIGCQGEIGWGRKNLVVGEYVRLYYFSIKNEGKEFITCLAKLEKRVDST